MPAISSSAYARRYLVWAVVGSWVFYGLAVWYGEPEPHPVTLAYHYAGGLVVPAVALVMLLRCHGVGFRQDYWSRALDPRRIGGRWWVVTLGLPPLLMWTAGLLDRGSGGAGVQWETSQFLAEPWAMAPFAVFIFIFGPLPEELGWRGYALDGLRRRYGAVGASLLLGVVWGVWHYPLYFIEGSYQAGRRDALLMVLQVVSCVGMSVVMTWVYLHTQRSTLSAVMIHFMINFSGELSQLSRSGEVWLAALWVVAAMLLVWRGGLRKPPRGEGYSSGLSQRDEASPSAAHPSRAPSSERI